MSTSKGEVTQEEAKQLRGAFAKIDADGDGRLSAAELQATLGSVLKIEKTEAEVRELIRQGDVDGDGTIDFYEFVLLVRSLKEREAKAAAGNSGLANVVAGLLEEWNVDATEEDSKRVLVPLGMQHYTSEQLSRLFS